MTKVREIMTPNPVVCAVDATLQEVAQKMAEADTGFIPLQENGRITMIVTDRDMAVRALAKGADAKARVRDFATPAHESISPDDTLEKAADQMEHWHVRRLVVTEGDRAVGVISLGDIAEHLPEKAQEVLVEVSRSLKTLNKSEGR